MSIDGSIALTVSITQTSSHPQNDAEHRPLADYAVALTQGAGTIANELQYYVGGTAEAVAAADSYDLAGGLTDVYGTTVTAAKLMGLFIYNKGTVSGQDLTLGGYANHVPLFAGTSEKVTIGPGVYWQHWQHGIAVTGGSGDIVYIDPGSGTVEYEYGFVMA